MVNVGIIGLGPVWETRYAPVLDKFRKRIAVCAIFDPVADRAQQVAAEYGAQAVQGILALLERDDVRSVLLLDTAWHGQESLRLICSRNKPAYLSGNWGTDAGQLQQLHERSRAAGLTLMPEFGRRYTPATGRLQELMATRIGRPRKIMIDATGEFGEPGTGSAREFLTGLLDWCQYILRMPAVCLQAKPLNSPADGGFPDCLITLEFCQPRSHGDRPVAELRVRNRRSDEEFGHKDVLRHEIVCDSGNAIIESGATISWSTGSSPITESLTADRSAVEVMLDHFCRRVVGGLIPVADVGDVCRSVAMAEAAEQSLRTGQAVSLNGSALS
jgi:predicted dehydrogenase